MQKYALSLPGWNGGRWGRMLFEAGGLVCSSSIKGLALKEICRVQGGSGRGEAVFRAADLGILEPSDLPPGVRDPVRVDGGGFRCGRGKTKGDFEVGGEAQGRWETDPIRSGCPVMYPRMRERTEISHHRQNYCTSHFSCTLPGVGIRKWPHQ